MAAERPQGGQAKGHTPVYMYVHTGVLPVFTLVVRQPGLGTLDNDPLLHQLLVQGLNGP